MEKGKNVKLIATVIFIIFINNYVFGQNKMFGQKEYQAFSVQQQVEGGQQDDCKNDTTSYELPNNLTASAVNRDNTNNTNNAVANTDTDKSGSMEIISLLNKFFDLFLIACGIFGGIFGIFYIIFFYPSKYEE